MYSARRYCVQRHIDNIHKGKANAIPFVEIWLAEERDRILPREAFLGSGKQRTVMEKTEDELKKCLPEERQNQFYLW